MAGDGVGLSIGVGISIGVGFTVRERFFIFYFWISTPKAYQKLYMWKGFRHLRHTRSSNISKTKNTSYAVILWGTRESVFFWFQKKNILSDGFPWEGRWFKPSLRKSFSRGIHIPTHAMIVNSVFG